MSTRDAQKRLLYLHRENARLRRRIGARVMPNDRSNATDTARTD